MMNNNAKKFARNLCWVSLVAASGYAYGLAAARYTWTFPTAAVCFIGGFMTGMVGNDE